MIRPAEAIRAYRMQRRPLTFARASLYAFILLTATSWGFILFGGDSGVSYLFTSKTWSNAGRFLSSMLGLNSDLTPAYWQASRWLDTGKLAYHTLAMSVLAIGIAGIGAFLTLLLAARNVSNGDLGGAPSRAGAVAYYLTRASYTFSRGVPELVWAMIIVFFLSPGILPGALALGFHNYGILGRLTAEVVENLDPAPARALRAAGAGNTKMLLYGILPQALPQFITYLLYRWEVVIRTTVVVGFVSAGGLGREFILRLSWFHYTDVSLIIVWYLALVIGVDLLSAGLRRLSRFD
ncbi:MAG: ABC transporter permease subunit [Chloroflexi bacterium]|nr:ABC transporter permease subunit [Chloroflexota bacterium]MDA1219962.1 ABC transporter permease subunit [Chloroflexota bacterium]